jgi:formate dehydrogenase maturation protein FdhE
MTQESKNLSAPHASSTVYGTPERAKENGVGGELSNDVIPTCPLCHTSTAAMTVHALREGAYWRCTRCGQMWDAIRLQTAASYTRYAQLQVRP